MDFDKRQINFSVDKVLNSDNYTNLLKLLVKEEIKVRGKETIPRQKPTDVFTEVSRGHSDLLKLNKTPIIPINDLSGKLGLRYSEEEKQLRCQLASTYRLMDKHGWTLNVYNHITLRLGGQSKEFFVNPIGPLFHEITASSLIKINLDGQTLDPGSTVFGLNMAGWVLHAALHSIRDDVMCIIHTHIPEVIAVSCMEYGLLPLSEEAVTLLDESEFSVSRGVRYHKYWGIAVDKEEWESISIDIGPHSKVLFLRNHGVLACGKDCAEAWYLVKRVVRACQNQIRLLNEVGEKALLAMPHVEGHKGHVKNAAHKIRCTKEVFEADLRILDESGYHTGYRFEK